MHYCLLHKLKAIVCSSNRMTDSYFIFLGYYFWKLLVGIDFGFRQSRAVIFYHFSMGTGGQCWQKIDFDAKKDGSRLLVDDDRLLGPTWPYLTISTLFSTSAKLMPTITTGTSCTVWYFFIAFPHICSYKKTRNLFTSSLFVLFNKKIRYGAPIFRKSSNNRGKSLLQSRNLTNSMLIKNCSFWIFE